MSARSGVPARAIASTRRSAELLHSSARPRRWSTRSSSSVGRGGAVPGWNRTPTMVVCAGMTSISGPVSGPTSWGWPPIGKWISTPPVGRCRCTYAASPVRWIQTVRTTPANSGDGGRST
jgi:hypothetical protein